jgi:hypothetical protein
MAFGRLGSIGAGFGHLGASPGGGVAAPSGGAALLVGETDGFAIDFAYPADASRVAVKVASATTSYGLDAFLQNAGTSPKQVFDVAGTLVWSPHNMFLNSDAPATQSVTTVVGQNYTVTVTGSGSMTGSAGASGVATAGAPLTYTATTLTSTFTLGGSLTRIQMNRGAVATAFLATTAAIRNGLAVNYDPVTHAALGLLCEPAATNVLLNNATLSTQSVTVSATAYTLSFFGTGTVTLSGVSTAGPLVGTGASDRVRLTFTPTAGSLTLTVTGTVSRAQLETGSAATSPIPTYGVAVTRAIDAVTVLTATFPWSAAGANTILCTAASNVVANGIYWNLHDGTDTDRYLLTTSSGTKFADVLIIDNSAVQATMSNAGTPVAGTYYKIALAANTNDFAMCSNGGAVVTDVAGTLPTVTTLLLGGQRTATARDVYVKDIKIIPRRMTNVDMQAATT